VVEALSCGFLSTGTFFGSAVLVADFSVFFAVSFEAGLDSDFGVVSVLGVV